MKAILTQLLHDFHERHEPGVMHRTARFSQLPGKADVVIGMRRTGKTFCCYQKIHELMASGIPKQRILYLNFEDDRLLGFEAGHFQSILDVFFAEYPENKEERCFFFFDEIQIILNWESFIRRLLDTENVQVFITGSSSKMLSSEIATSLRGRSMTTEVFPLSFEEYLAHHGIFPELPKTFGSRNAAKLRRAAADYFDTGGFPEIRNLDAYTRIEILQGYIDSVLLKDVVQRHQISNVTALRHLVRHIMISAGRLFSVTKFYNTLKSMGITCTRNNLYAWVDYLADAFLVYKVPVHTRSERSRSTSPVKLYAVDTGLLRAMAFRTSSDNGLLLENMVFMHLRRQGYEMAYVKTPNNLETDFLARHRITGDIQLVQVCWDISDEKTFKREVRGLEAAMEMLAMDRGTIVTWDHEQDMGNHIKMIPVWKWLVFKGPYE